MQKWEYLYVTKYSANNQWRPFTLNGAEIRDWKKGPSIYEFFNRLGDEGWEMFAVDTTGYGSYYFKRPKV